MRCVQSTCYLISEGIQTGLNITSSNTENKKEPLYRTWICSVVNLIEVLNVSFPQFNSLSIHAFFSAHVRVLSMRFCCRFWIFTHALKLQEKALAKRLLKCNRDIVLKGNSTRELYNYAMHWNNKAGAFNKAFMLRWTRELTLYCSSNLVPSHNSSISSVFSL